MTALLKNHAQQVRNIMDAQLSRAAHIWFVADEDRNRFDFTSTSLLPNVSYHQSDRPFAPPPGRSALLFVGGRGFHPNESGLQRFLQNCWPRITEAIPDATLTIVGSGWDELESRYQSEKSIRFLGFVDDLHDVFCDADIFVAPIYEGAGTKIKVIEALTFGRSVVADTHAARGYKSDFSGEGLEIAGDDNEMVEKCVALLGDPNRNAALAEQAWRRANKDYRRSKVEQSVYAVCAGLLASDRSTTAHEVAS